MDMTSPSPAEAFAGVGIPRFRAQVIISARSANALASLALRNRQA